MNKNKKKNSEKISKMRNNRKLKNKLKNVTISALVSQKGDKRVYASTEVGGMEVLALLDSGASASCIGKGGEKLLKGRENLIKPIKSQGVRTADGAETPVTGTILLSVTWDGENKNLEFLIVPALTQEVYFGIDFWRTFGLDLVSKGKNVICDSSCDTNCDIESDYSVIAELELSESDQVVPLNQHELNAEQQQQLDQVKALFPSFAVMGLGKTHLEEHIIEVTDENTPIKQRHYPISPVVQKLMYDELDRMLSLGVIEESNSSWSSPVTLVRQPNKNRLCLDARKVNERTIKDAYPLPHINGILSRLQDTKYISAIDLKDAFWQIPLEQKSREKTAFTVPGRPLYQYTVMPFGLCNAAQRMSRLMDKIFSGKLRERVFVYLDDLLVTTATFEEHIVLLTEVAICLKNANLTINVEKSKFCFKELKYLGYIVGGGCIRTDEAKVAAVRDFPEPKTPKQLRRVIGICGWYRSFIKDYATIVAPLTDCLTKDKIKKFSLTEEAKAAFEQMKLSLMSAPVLVNPDFTKHFYIQCDASSVGVGGVLFQLDDENNERPIAFMSAKLNKAQKNYSVTELECYAAVLSVKKFRPYVEGLPFTIITDHASLKWLMNQKDLSGRLARWSLKLQAFDFNIMHRKGSQNVVPDTLSRMYMEAIEICDRSLDIDLDSPYFASADYETLKKTVETSEDECPDLCVSDKYVYKRTEFSTGEDIFDDQSWKLWVPTELRQELLEKAHSSHSAGHGGMHKTLQRLRTFYYWPGMVNDVQSLVKTCDICRSTKTSNSTRRPLMGAQQITERPFQRIYIDFMGPYPRGKEGHTHIFVCLDHMTKFVFLKPMRKATSAEVVKFLEKDIFHTFGVPEYVHSDNGKQFVSLTFTNFLNKYAIQHIKTAFYSPQSNCSERVNRSVLQIIRTYIGENQKNWDSCLSDVAFALRSAVHSSIKTTPYYALFGMHMMQHADSYKVARNLGAICHNDNLIQNKDDRMQLLREHLMKALKAAHDKSEKTYNTRAKDIKFQVGQVVYRKNFKQSDLTKGFNAKLAPTNIKCIVLKTIGNSLYELGNMAGKSLGVYHAKDMFVA